ncbi:MAG: hypothetical protein ACXVP5_06295 [Tumebacillaceae bacterium]
MKNVVLKPELRTPGGETVSIYCDDEWAGDLYLVYREGDILTGTMQIDTSKVSEHELDAVSDEVRAYVEHLNSALGVQDSSVVMMYGDISSVVEMEPYHVAAEEVIVDADIEDDMVEDFYEDDEEGVYVAEQDLYEDDVQTDSEFHLSVAYKNGEHTKYHLHDEGHNAVGVISVDEIAENVSGRVEFWDMPDEDQTADVARMLAREFSDGGTEQISFTMNYQDQHLGDMHLESRDYL